MAALAEREACEVAGVSLPEYRLLAMLYSEGGMGVGDLQRLTLLDKAWISRTVGSLTQKKLVHAEPDSHDARRVKFSLTARGRKVAGRLIETAAHRPERALECLAAAKVSQFLKWLAHIGRNVIG
jgi:DNA-binding MarR family transcriptional regulator